MANHAPLTTLDKILNTPIVALLKSGHEYYLTCEYTTTFCGEESTIFCGTFGVDELHDVILKEVGRAVKLSESFNEFSERLSDNSMIVTQKLTFVSFQLVTSEERAEIDKRNSKMLDSIPAI